jgi:glutaconyl-CoA decarboxylase
MEASMKRYNIRVNGTVYAVEVEEADAPAVHAAPVSPQASPPVPVPAPASVPAPAAKASSAPAENATIVDCQIPGSVLSVLVVPGQAVKSGETLLVLEAMKMENEIVAPQDGTVDTVRVRVGAAVDAGDVLVTLL